MFMTLNFTHSTHVNLQARIQVNIRYIDRQQAVRQAEIDICDGFVVPDSRILI